MRQLTNSSAVWRYLTGYKDLLRAIENLGIAVVYGIRYYSQGNLTEDNFIKRTINYLLLCNAVREESYMKPVMGVKQI